MRLKHSACSMKCSVQRIWPQRPLVIIVFNFSDMFRQVDPWVVHYSAFCHQLVLARVLLSWRWFSGPTILMAGSLNLAWREVPLYLPLSLLTRLFLLPGKCLFVRIVVESIFLTNIIGHKYLSWCFLCSPVPIYFFFFCENLFTSFVIIL